MAIMYKNRLLCIITNYVNEPWHIYVFSRRVLQCSNLHLQLAKPNLQSEWKIIVVPAWIAPQIFIEVARTIFLRAQNFSFPTLTAGADHAILNHAERRGKGKYILNVPILSPTCDLVKYWTLIKARESLRNILSHWSFFGLRASKCASQPPIKPTLNA